MYTIEELLAKMGAPEVKERGRMEWHYFETCKDDPSQKELAGYAEIRFEKGGELLVAELKRLYDVYEDDNGQTIQNHTEHFYMTAERTARPGHYRVTYIAFDGAEYNNPKKPIVEIGLGVFHAKALDISILMVEQAFNKQDIFEPVNASKPVFKNYIAQKKQEARKETFGVVVPFRPRRPEDIPAAANQF